MEGQGGQFEGEIDVFVAGMSGGRKDESAAKDAAMNNEAEETKET